MLDFSLGELLLIAVVTIIVVGPQDMPKVLKSVIGIIRQLQAVTNEVRKGVDELIASSGIKEVEHDLKTIIDQDGNVQPVYDISEFLEDKSGEKTRVLTERDLYDKS